MDACQPELADSFSTSHSASFVKVDAMRVSERVISRPVTTRSVDAMFESRMTRSIFQPDRWPAVVEISCVPADKATASQLVNPVAIARMAISCPSIEISPLVHSAGKFLISLSIAGSSDERITPTGSTLRRSANRSTVVRSMRSRKVTRIVPGVRLANSNATRP